MKIQFHHSKSPYEVEINKLVEQNRNKKKCKNEKENIEYITSV